MKAEVVSKKPTIKRKKLLLQGQVFWGTEEHPASGVRIKLVAAGHKAKKGQDSLAATSTKTGKFRISIAADKFSELDLSKMVLYAESKEGASLLERTTLPLQPGKKDNEIQIALPNEKQSLVDGSGPASGRIAVVGDMELDAQELEKLKPETLICIAKAVVNKKISKRERNTIERLSPKLLLPDRRDAHELTVISATPILEVIDELIRIKDWPRDLQVQIEEILGRLNASFASVTVNCGDFRVTYQTTGADAVDLSQAAEDVFDPGTTNLLTTLPAGTMPTYIKRICFWLQRALNSYINAPFSLRNPAASGLIPVNIINIPYGFANPSGMTLGNQMADDLICAVAVHELFHMVQYEYSISGDWRSAMIEGGAVFAEDSAADSMNRYLDEADNNFNGPGLLVQPNLALPTASYKTSLFWRYIAEQLSSRIRTIHEPKIGVETYKAIIEACDAGSTSTADIETAVRNLPWYQRLAKFGYLDAARLDRTSSETTLGNFALACYLKDQGINVPDRRFDFMEDEENIHIDDVIGATTSTTLRSVALSGSGTLTSTNVLNFTAAVNRFGRHYFEIGVDSAVTNLVVDFTANIALIRPIFQIALIDEDGNVRDIHRTDHANYTKMLTNLRGTKKLRKIVLVVSGAETAGNFSIQVNASAPSSDVMITRWHSIMKTEYEIDSRDWAWTWISPDVWVDNNGDGVADSTVFFNRNNKLKLRMHNKGNLAATNISIQFYYQNASGGLQDSDWQPVRDDSNTIQTRTGLTLAAGTSRTVEVNWAPVPDGASSHFCIKAVVTSPGDINQDNKRLVSNFGNVVMPFAGSVDIGIVRRRWPQLNAPVQIRVVPHGLSDFKVSTSDLRAINNCELQPGNERTDTLRIFHHPNKELIDLNSVQSKLSENRKNVVPKEALPPGIDPKNLVTLVHEVDGVALGGVSFNLQAGKNRTSR